MQRALWTVSLVAILAGGVVAGRLQAQTKTAVPIPAPVSVTSGRWQVVSGAPEFRDMVMLLDTATGQTWIQCSNDQGAQGWCRMFRSEAATGQDHIEVKKPD